jgi:MFS transporter, putative metabolite:H+ symporter
MAAIVNAGARLDRLPVSALHRRIFWLIGAGMFFDGYDLYVGAPVLGSAVQSGFSSLPQNAQFFFLTFLGMTVGALVAGFLGDRYGRRFTYQFNLMIFGLASIAAAFAPNIEVLNGLRFIMGLGLGAEIVVGYSTMTEFVPPASRGKWLSFMAFIVVAGLPVTAILGNFIIPAFGWRPMFAIAGIGSLIVWYLRKALPESPRWLERHGRTEEAEALMQALEKEASGGKPLPAPAAASAPASSDLGSLFRAPLLQRMIVGSVVLITVNALIFGFVNWIPTFFVKQGLTVSKSLGFTLVIDLGSLIGCTIGAFGADALGRRRTILGATVMTIVFGAIYPFVSEDWQVLTVGFFLIVGIYILTALLYGVYTTELFPTEVRLRANGICNMFGRGTTVVTSSFLIVALFQAFGVGGVLSLMIGLLVIQFFVVLIWGIEPAKRRLEELDPGSAAAK